MFGLLRLLTFSAVAFVVGVLYERANANRACDALAGLSTNGLCVVKDVPQ